MPPSWHLLHRWGFFLATGLLRRFDRQDAPIVSDTEVTAGQLERDDAKAFAAGVLVFVFPPFAQLQDVSDLKLAIVPPALEAFEVVKDWLEICRPDSQVVSDRAA